MERVEMAVWKVAGWGWILSPLVFIACRLTGLYNFRCDVAVFGVLSLISFVTMFLTFKPKGESK